MARTNEARFTTETMARRKKGVVAATAGTTLEWYDYSVYAAVATWIAADFFPDRSDESSLLGALAVFGVGFFFRPLGAVVFGHIGDRFGRKTALAGTITLMGVATLLLACSPTYAVAGIWGPMLLVVARCGQGFSGGGEFAGGATFLVEGAPTGKRGLFGAIHYMAVILGNVLGAALVAVLIVTLSDDEMSSWGWRVPFFIGAAAAGAGLYIRSRIPDTPVMQKARQVGDVAVSPTREAWSEQRRVIVRGFGLVVGFTVVTYAYVNMQSYIPTVSDLSKAQAAWIYTASLAIQVPLIGVFGALSDRVGRRPLLIVGSALLTVCSIPSFLLLSAGSVAFTFVALLLTSVSIAVYSGGFTAAITELMPRRTRYTALSVSYGFAVALFGGTAGWIVAWLNGVTGSGLAPAIYATVAAAATLATALSTPESSKADLNE